MDPAASPAGRQPHRVRFDGTLNLGHVLTIVTLIVGGGVAYGTLDTRLAAVEKEVADLPDLKTLVQTQQVQIGVLMKQDDLTRESLRRLFDRLDVIGKDVATIKGQLAKPE